MKKIIKIVIISFVIISTILVAINIFYKTKYNPTVKVETNFNNIAIENPSVWATNEHFYYETGYNILRVDKEGNTDVLAGVDELREFENHLSENDSGIYNDFQVFDDNTYFWYRTSNGLYEFYKVNNNTLKCKKIYTSYDYINRWTVVDNSLIFTSKEEAFGVMREDLKIFDFSNKKEIQIDSKAISFGVVNKKIRYVKHNTKAKSTKLYEYSLENKSKQLLAEFSGNSYNCWDFNYTEDKLILFKRKTLFVYDIASSKISEYKFNERINYISCFGKSAFIETEVAYGTSNIYHLELTTGRTEQLLKEKYVSTIFSVNEDNIFVLESENSPSVLKCIHKTGKEDLILMFD